MECHSFRLSNGLFSFSPNGLFAAFCNQQRLTVCLISDFQPIRVIQCSEIVEQIEWSTDSELLLSAYIKKGKLEVWSVAQPEWKCKISTGSLGLITAQFAPSSRHVLATARLHLRITIWSLSDQNVCHINLPKAANPGIDFCVGGTHMAVVERRMALDCVAIYSCDTWTQVTLIDCAAVDIGGVKWSPDGSKIAIWDGISHSGKLGIYLISGSQLAEITNLFGIHSIEWSPSAQILAVATVGSKVKLINHLSWNPIATLNHPAKIRESTCVIYCESEDQLKYQIVEDRPFTLPGESSVGQLILAFSSDARYLAVFDQQRPRVLWIWELPYFSLKSVLVHCSAIRSFKWSHTDPRLATVCGNGNFYAWTPVGSAITDLRPTNIIASALKADRADWTASGEHLMIAGKDVGCVCQVK
ncbi:WD repeat-containing protein WRAP73-like [Daphnia pulex]|uniref:WD repeat-containing protein WRAP73-like n=1 Tax=Daphnia pulex TaxID=6669 RepID=UPI001EE04210|nr:WD repeat-containing protein WRAP73-like [Daphnia pulex]XP_046444232.1 WD repeat-containing protein WRAP73-like [Daphnia pulex]XP_046444233.1 WD repeat-containing protein WRAP73-like [Daphnia pulex]